jgi:Mn-containing catalase
MLLEQFGGGNGELKAAMQYFTQAFLCRHPYPDKYDLLMDIATEEFSHLEIVGATITMLLQGVNGELKDAAEGNFLTKLMNGKAAKEETIHDALYNPQFLVLSGGGPTATDSNGIPWNGHYVNANGDLTVDLRSNVGAESRAKIVYEYLTKFTDDPLVQDTLQFLMTREIAHLQMFEAALESIQPNFPPGILQGDPRFTHAYFNMSDGVDVRGPWNEGRGPWPEGEWKYIDDPVQHVRRTEGLTKQESTDTRSREELDRKNRELAKKRSTEINKSMGSGEIRWSNYSERKAS